MSSLFARAYSVLVSFFQILGRCWPLQVGCGYLAQFLPTPPSAPETDDAKCRLRTGAVVYVPPDDFVGRALFYFGDLDPKLTWLLQRLVHDGDTVIDIGANLGLSTFAAAAEVGATGAVHAFEPQPSMVRRLHESKEANSFANVHIHPVALGSHTHTTDLYVPPGNKGAASLNRRHRPNGHDVSVSVKEAGVFLRTLSVAPIRFLKLDVEGHEADILDAAASFLTDHRTDYIFLEVDRTWSAPLENQSPLAVLRSLGYDLYNVPRTPFRNVVERIPPGEAPRNPGHDILAARPECAAELDETLQVRRARLRNAS